MTAEKSILRLFNLKSLCGGMHLVLFRSSHLSPLAKLSIIKNQAAALSSLRAALNIPDTDQYVM